MLLLARFGYAHEFDRAGHEGDVAIDLAPALHPLLFATRHGAPLRASLPRITQTPWIRHDEHYPVDFARSSPPAHM